MAVLWEADGSMTVRQVLDALNEDRQAALAYTTVMTTLGRLTAKGLANREAQGRGYRYEAAVRDPAGAAVRGVVRQFGDAALAHFVDEVGGDEELRRRLQRLLDEDRHEA